jgi:hypothetical protein
MPVPRSGGDEAVLKAGDPHIAGQRLACSGGCAPVRRSGVEVVCEASRCGRGRLARQGTPCVVGSTRSGRQLMAPRAAALVAALAGGPDVAPSLVRPLVARRCDAPHRNGVHR